MRADEYDALIADPTGFLYDVWLPRVSTEVSKIGSPSTCRNNLSFVKGAMAMLSYFYAFGPQIARLRSECGVAMKPARLSGPSPHFWSRSIFSSATTPAPSISPAR